MRIPTRQQKLLKSGFSLSVILLYAAASSAQNLGEIARQERERKQHSPVRATHIYTDADLKRAQILVPEDQARVLAARNSAAAPAAQVAQLPAPSPAVTASPVAASAASLPTSPARVQVPAAPVSLEPTLAALPPRATAAASPAASVESNAKAPQQTPWQEANATPPFISASKLEALLTWASAEAARPSSVRNVNAVKRPTGQAHVAQPSLPASVAPALPIEASSLPTFPLPAPVSPAPMSAERTLAAVPPRITAPAFMPVPMEAGVEIQPPAPREAAQQIAPPSSLQTQPSSQPFISASKLEARSAWAAAKTARPMPARTASYAPASAQLAEPAIPAIAVTTLPIAASSLPTFPLPAPVSPAPVSVGRTLAAIPPRITAAEFTPAPVEAKVEIQPPAPREADREIASPSGLLAQPAAPPFISASKLEALLAWAAEKRAARLNRVRRAALSNAAPRSDSPRPHHSLPNRDAIDASTVATLSIRRGDSLWKVAKLYLGSGSRWRELAALNTQISNANLLYVGERIHLPAAAVQTAHEAAPPAEHVEASVAHATEAAAQAQPRLTAQSASHQPVD